MKKKYLESLEPITDFKKLGSGWDCQLIVVLREGRIWFVSNVKHSWPSQGIVIFKNSKIFKLRSLTIEGKKVSLLLWKGDERLQRLWRVQCEIDPIESWLKDASPGDAITLSQLIAAEGDFPKSRHVAVDSIKAEILDRLEFLNLRQLRQIRLLLNVNCAKAA